MSDSSERRLQRILNAQGFYTVRTPGSGTGITDPETDTRHDHPDVVAIQPHPAEQGSDVLVIEDKHADSYPVYVDPDQYDALAAVADTAHAYPVFAVQIKHTTYPHDFHTLPVTDRTDAGTYVLRADGEQTDVEALTDPYRRPIAAP